MKAFGEERTSVDLLVGELLGLVVALEGVLGLVHESRHFESRLYSCTVEGCCELKLKACLNCDGRWERTRSTSYIGPSSCPS